MGDFIRHDQRLYQTITNQDGRQNYFVGRLFKGDRTMKDQKCDYCQAPPTSKTCDRHTHQATNQAKSTIERDILYKNGDLNYTKIKGFLVAYRLKEAHVYKQVDYQIFYIASFHSLYDAEFNIMIGKVK